MKLQFCTECAAPLIKRSDTEYYCSKGHPYYNNPRAACTIIFINEKNELLYSKRAHEPAKGKYDFPGGFLDYGENAYDAAKREAHEELGITIDIQDLELIGCAANKYIENITTSDLIFLCRSWKGEFHPADDVASVAWRPLSFTRSPEFAWPHLYFSERVENYLKTL